MASRIKTPIIAGAVVLLIVSIWSSPGHGDARISQPVLDAQPVPPGPAVVVGAKAVLRKYTFSIDGVPIEWVVSEECIDTSDDYVVDERPTQFRIAASSIEYLMFGNDSDQESPVDRLAMLLKDRISELDRLCDLTNSQKQKLWLAGRGDIKRYIQHTDQLREAYLAHFVEEQDVRAQRQLVNELCRDVHNYGRNPYEGPFFELSLFTKTMRSCLNASQWDILKKTKFTSSVVVPPNADLRSWVTIKVELFVEE